MTPNAKKTADNRLGLAGQTLVLIPIVLTFLTAAFLASGYISQLQMQIGNSRGKTETNLIIENAFPRVKELLAAPSATPGCPDFSAFRDFSTTTLAPYSWTAASPNAAAASLPCVLSTADSGKLDSFSLSVARIGPPDLGSLSSTIQIRIQARSKPAPKAIPMLIQIDRTILLRTTTLSYFNVLVTGTPGQTALVQATGTATAAFNGDVLFTQRSNGRYTLSSLASFPPPGAPAGVVFNKHVFLRSQWLSPDTLANGLNTSDLKRVYRQGIETFVINDVSALPLPSETATGSILAAWSQKFDFHNSFVPLPDVSAYPPNQGAIVGETAVSDTYNDTIASITTLPNASAGYPTMDRTCLVNGSIVPAFVFQRYNQDLTLDFASDKGSDPVFCGLVMARKLTIKLGGDPSALYGLLGYFIVDSIVVQGQGQAIFYNPAENIAVDMPLPVGQSTVQLFGDFQRIAPGHARNFFVPLFRNPAAVQSLNPAIFAKYRPGTANPAAPNPYTLPCPKCSHSPRHICLMSAVPPLPYAELFTSLGGANSLSFVAEDAL